VKGGTVAVLVRGSDTAGALGRSPVRLAALRRAAAFSVAAFIDGCSRLFQRYLRLGLLLLAVYAISAALYLLTVTGSYRLGPTDASALSWGLTALVSGVFIAWITIVNLAYLLVQMVVAAEDCSVRRAVHHLALFLRRKRGEVAAVFAVVLSLVIFATVASMLATAGLGLVSFVPLVGLAVFPLQAAAWLVRGLVFQYLGLTALGAYLALYRPPDASRAEAAHPVWARTAS
jgi:hypothetical protein